MAGVSSGKIEANTAVSIERAKIVSVHVHSNANCSTENFQVKIWDSRPETNGEYAAGGTQSKTKEILRVTCNKNNTADAFHLEQDLHGVMCNKGIYVEVVGNGSGQVYVTYA